MRTSETYESPGSYSSFTLKRKWGEDDGDDFSSSNKRAELGTFSTWRLPNTPPVHAPVLNGSGSLPDGTQLGQFGQMDFTETVPTGMNDVLADSGTHEKVCDLLAVFEVSDLIQSACRRSTVPPLRASGS